MGRKTKLNNEMIEALCGYIEAGMTNTDAIYLCNISPDAFYRWLRKSGEEDAKPIYKRFGDRMKAAEVRFKQEHIRRIREKAEEKQVVVREHIRKLPNNAEIRDIIKETRPTVWQASAWLLERKFPGEFSKKVVEIEGGNFTSPPPVFVIDFGADDEVADNS